MTRTLELKTGEVGVPWNKRLLYMCSTCAYPLLIKSKTEAKR